MAVTRKTLDFLPGIFRTDTNRKFLGSTLDQLVSEPSTRRIDGFVGRRFSPSSLSSDNFKQEPTSRRQNYQLEPGVVVKKDGEIDAVADYIDLINKIEYYGGNTTNHDRLFESEFYSFDPFINLDKLVNYSQYYWLPSGPPTVTISSNTPSFTGNVFNFNIDTSTGSREYSVGSLTSNPTLYLTRGQTYTFTIPAGSFHRGKLFIQTQPGIDGINDFLPQVSTREILGLSNNGIEIGQSMTFTVPARDAQDNLIDLELAEEVNYAIAADFNTVDNMVYTNGASIDSQDIYPDDKLVIFTGANNADSAWTDRNGAVIAEANRRGIWRTDLVRLPDGTSRIHLTFVRTLSAAQRVRILSGNRQGRNFYRVGVTFQLMPMITAPLNVLWYHNDTDDVCGEIRIVDQNSLAINVDNDIVGKKTYTANNIRFTNGLKIRFDTTVQPSTYHNQVYVVEGVGSAIQLIPFANLFGSDTQDQDYIVGNRASADLNPWARANRWYHVDTIVESYRINRLPLTFANTRRAQRPIIEFKPNLELMNSGRVFLLLVDNLFDSDSYRVVNAVRIPINNAFTQVENKLFDELAREKLILRQGQLVVFANDTSEVVRNRIYRIDYQDQTTSTAFTSTLTGNITGQQGLRQLRGTNTQFLSQVFPGVDIFDAANQFVGRVTSVRDNYEFTIDRDLAANIVAAAGYKFIKPKVLLTTVGTAENRHCIFVTKGANRNRTYHYLNKRWNLSQQKTDRNQAPLFDLVLQGVDPATGLYNTTSLGDYFPNSEFAGSKLFSYKTSETSPIDPILGFAMSFQGAGDFIADINFVNNYEADQFQYTEELGVFTSKIYTIPVNRGYVRKNIGLNDFELLTPWNSIGITQPRPSRQYQIISTVYDGYTSYIELGSRPEPNPGAAEDRPNIRVYINNNLLTRETPTQALKYNYEQVGVKHCLRIDPALLSAGDRIDIEFYSRTASSVAYYEIPDNLEFNPQNETITNINLGQLRRHLTRVAENTQGLIGRPIGQSNIRDIDTDHSAGSIMQHSAPLTYAMLFLTDDRLSFIDSLEYAKREYTKFKNKFLELSTVLDTVSADRIVDSVDELLKNINQTKKPGDAFYYSDMVPSGKATKITRLPVVLDTVTNAVKRSYGAASSAFSKDNLPSSRAILVHLDDRQLILDKEYKFDSSGLIRIENSVALAVGQQIVVREYSNTDGSFVPETPTKLGLYPKFEPIKYLDNTYREPIQVIQGHDGSLTPAFNDYRDDLLLELERRIYNNLKVEYNPVTFDLARVIPGYYRITDYTLAEYNRVLNTEFLKWIGRNQVDYSTNNNFVNNDEFSYNYNRIVNDRNTKLPGYWRGIYKYYYDTDRPHSHPWEMLGHTIKPTWWDANYSWTDPVKRASLIISITQGMVGNPANPITNQLYARPGFSQAVPVDSAGNLVSPLRLVVRDFDSAQFDRRFSIGDHGPAETAWRRSSEYAFAVQRAMALLKPARYFAMTADTSRIAKTNINGLQYVHRTTGKRWSTGDVTLNGELKNGQTTRASGYINWILGFLSGLGLESSALVRTSLNNITVNLVHRLAAFTDKKFIDVLADQGSPTSINDTVVIPNENYQLTMSAGTPVRKATYSGVIVEKTSAGWSVNGYDLTYPYFTVIPSATTGNSHTIDVLGNRVTVFTDFRNEKLIVPYGFEFSTIQQVGDFLISYQRYLVSQGFQFNYYDPVLAVARDWELSVREFLTWTTQGWPEGTVLILSPIADVLNFYSTNTAVDGIYNRSYNSQILGPNFNIIPNTEFTVLRDSKVTKITTISGQTIAFAQFNLVQYENLLVFDNTTVFNDVLYLPNLGNRQYKLKIVGSVTDGWDGDLTPPGFVYQSGKVDAWQVNTDYRKGDVVKYKGKNYTAVQNITATATFNYNYWVELDSIYDAELIQNFAHDAAQFESFYDVDNLPIDENFARFAMSLIGYRNRSYLEDLGMNMITQTKFYQGYIKEKGTYNAVRALSRAHFDNLDSSVEIYEEWAARVGEYGAIDSNPEINLIIRESVYNDNPIALEFLEYNQLPTSRSVPAIYPNQLLTKKLDYTKNIFLNRNPDFKTELNHIEMFGDSLICGQQPKSLVAYSIAGIETASYSVEVIQASENYSVTMVYSSNGGTIVDSIGSGVRFDLRITSEFLIESLEYQIDEVAADEQPGTISGLGELSAGEVDPGTILNLHVTSLDSEDLSYSIEVPSPEDIPGSTTDTVRLVKTVQAGEQIKFGVTGIDNNETLWYSIETPTSEDAPGSMTYEEFITACTIDRVTNRVPDTPDYLLYEALDDDIRAAVIIRSVGNSTSGNLLYGEDGANQLWPDEIDADIVVINHGMRDAERNISLGEYRNNLIQLRKRLPAQKIVIWLTPTPIYTGLTNIVALPDPRLEWARKVDINNYVIAMRQVARLYGDYLADATNIPNWFSYLTEDGIHPNQEGYRVLVDTVLAPRVREAVRDLARRKLKKYEDDIISAGYVNRNDVNELIFDITQYVPTTARLESYYTGYKIWVAKNYDKDWQVYRLHQHDLKVIAAEPDLDSRFTFVCDRPHNLKVNDAVAIRNINSVIDGFYQIYQADELTFTVFGTEEKIRYLDGNDVAGESGELFAFVKMRFASIKQRDLAEPVHGWLADDLLYVDDTGFGTWAVYKPRILDVDYVTDYVDTVVLSNVYSVVAHDCDFPDDSLVTDVSDGEDINFCVTSANETETLYWTVEQPAGDDLVATVITTGISNTLLTTTQLRSVNRYELVEVKRETPKVDIDSINNLYLYDYISKRILARLDILDPAKGRVLGAALQDIDFTSTYDPARYRYAENYIATQIDTEYYWGEEQVGTYWWNIDTCRYLDYEQDSLDYRLENWGKLFPGSSIDIYEWISSDVIPSEHVDQGREGIPLYADDSRYSMRIHLDPATNAYRTVYYFWVKGRIPRYNKAKRNSTYVIADMIANPIQQGIPYLVALRDNAIALYNVGAYLQNDTTALFVSSKKLINENIVHTDYQLIQEGNEDSKFPARVENKIIDSIAGIDAYGRYVPDNNLSTTERVGYELFPRQTVIANRFKARRNVVLYANEVLARYPVARRVIDRYRVSNDNFYASHEPVAADYDIAIANFASLDAIVPVNNNRVLVQIDEASDNYWSIYRCVKILDLANTPDQNADQYYNLYNKIIAEQKSIRQPNGDIVKKYNIFGYKRLQRQSYKVPNHWSFINWYAEGYSDLTVPTYTVDRVPDLHRLQLHDGDTVKILQVPFGTVDFQNPNNTMLQKFELYQFNLVDGKLQQRLVGLQDGTIKISENFFLEQGFDSTAFDSNEFDFSIDTEFRYILQGLKEDVFVADLENEYNKLLFYIIDYILSEQRYIDWFLKTSFITLKYRVNGLLQSPSYVQDRQQNFEDYVQEVKPYRVKLRQYILNHGQTDVLNTGISDFDLPAYYDFTLNRFRSPNGEIDYIDELQLAKPEYRDWLNNHGYSLANVAIASGGYGYFGCHDGRNTPVLVVDRVDTETGANAAVRLTVGGTTSSITAVTVTNPGSNYLQTPRVSLVGYGGTRVNDLIVDDYRVVAVGSNDTSKGAKADFGLYRQRRNSLTNLYVSTDATYVLHKIRRYDGKVTFTGKYQTASSADEARKLAFELSITNADSIVVIHTYGDAAANRIDELQEQMYRCGASEEVFGSLNFMTGAAYILVGIPGVGKSNGIENYSGLAANSSTAYASLVFRLQRGRLVPISADPHIYSIGAPVAFPASFPENQIFTYANKQWIRLSNESTRPGWAVYKRPVGMLAGEKEFVRAQLVPVLGNNPIRKIKTVLRFDRISRGSNLVDWTANTAYSAGIYLVYGGRVYLVTENMPASAVFLFNNVQEVGADAALAATRNYRNGFFDNANDRIMSYYVPSESNGNVPKELSRLVDGLQVTSSIVASQAIGPDTILLGDAQSSDQGILSGNIKVSGGRFVDSMFSVSPEELLPGITYDTINIRVEDQTDPTRNVKIFVNMNRQTSYLTHGAVYATTLAQAVNINDTTITVQDGSVLAEPNVGTLTPGIIEVNGERISYYTKTGNVLGQLRRGVGGTGTPAQHLAGSRVEDVAQRRVIPAPVSSSPL